MTRDIRELAQRAELEFHQQPHRFRRRAWLWGVVLGLACGGWMLWAAVSGDYRAFDAGELSRAHGFIGNDCRQCHTTWQPVKRLFSIGSHVESTTNSSITNAACVKCHAAAEHNHRQIPAHASLSCAECHREHQGKLELASVTDQHCVRCHADLKTSDESNSLFAHSIRGFSSTDGHPEFNLSLRLKSDSAPSNLITRAEFDALVKEAPEVAAYQARFLDVLAMRPAPDDQKPGPPAKSKWRDRGDIKFNHAAHLGPKGVKDQQGNTVFLTGNCQACHVPDPSGRYMQPIAYQKHCVQCHPLLFDNQNFPGDSVPHARPDIVRGFLTQKYTLNVLNQKQTLVESQPPRPLPGQPDRGPLNVEQAKQLEGLVTQAERMAQDHTRVVKSRGGCKLCHTVSETAADGTWTVQAPQMPTRWLPHSRFGHAAHRMLGCTECHQNVAKSRETGDVLMPTIADCRECHISESATPRRKSQLGLAHEMKTSCILCHTYHQRPVEQPSGHLTKQLAGEPEAEPTGELERGN